MSNIASTNSTIKEISTRSREEILAKVRKGYQIPNFERKETEDPVVHIKFNGDLIANIKENMTNNKFVVHDVPQDKLYEEINKISAERNAQKLIYPKDLGLDLDKINAGTKLCFDKQIEDIRNEVFNSDFSIINAFAGVSSHGVACVASTENQPRMLSLVTPLCIMLLKKERVVKSLSEALKLVKSEKEVLPTNILFIAGPSRTSDVELVTVFGVHGSTEVHLILY